ncbi:MAG: hypothetical protein ACI9VR_001441 [Cognaticolwellia sp.]
MGPDGYFYVQNWNITASGCNSGAGDVLRYDPTDGSFVDRFATLDYRSHRMGWGPDGDLWVPYYCGESVVQIDGSTGETVANHSPITPARYYDIAFDPVGRTMYLSIGNVQAFDMSDWSLTSSFGSGWNNSMSMGPSGDLYVMDWHPTISPAGQMLVFEASTSTLLWSFPIPEVPYPIATALYDGL